MNMSFYTGAAGARQFTKKLDIVANNLANINTHGYQPKTAAFSQLVQYNLNGSEGEQTELQAGAGAKLSRTWTDFPRLELCRPEANMIMPLWIATHFLCFRILQAVKSVLPETDIST